MLSSVIVRDDGDRRRPIRRYMHRRLELRTLVGRLLKLKHDRTGRTGYVFGYSFRSVDLANR